jgi:hypothetical protein
VVASVVTLLEPRARDKHLAIESTVAPDVPRALRGDAARMRQVLLNLVANAIKFTDAGTVRVAVSRVDDQPTLRFAVTDTGIGIAADAQPRLFQLFSQVDHPEARRFGGTGLGLAISKKIVAAMGGDIGVDSAPDRGSTFWFVVPFALAAGAGAPDAARRDAPAAAVPRTEGARVEVPVAPLRILVAEDNPVNQEVAVGLLRRSGHMVDVVDDGRAAVAAVGAGTYDVVLMDLQMPVLDGIEATRAIRRLPGGKGDLPIIALSATVLPNAAQRALAAGMNAHLVKPIDPIALAAALAEHTRSADTRPTAPPSSSVIDAEHLRLLVDSLGPAKVAELVTELPGHVRPHRERLAAAQAVGDLPAVRAAAHALCGIAASLGLTALADLTGAIEAACLEEQAERVTALCERLDASLDEGLAELRALQA